MKMNDRLDSAFQMTKIFSILALVFGVTVVASEAALVIYDADFGTDGVGYTYNAGGSGIPDSSGSASGSNADSTNGFDLTYDGAQRGTEASSAFPFADLTENRFITAGGVVVIEDWGGDVTGSSIQISVTGIDSVDINLTATQFGGVSLNSLEWFYKFNNATEQNVTTTAGARDQLWESIDISGADSLWVGFRSSMNPNNGDETGFNITSMSVSAVPEPRTWFLLSFVLGAGLLLAWKRRGELLVA